MATSDGTVAVKVGYSFALVPESELGGIALKDTGSHVSVGGKDYELRSGRTYEDSRVLDGVLGRFGEMSIGDFAAPAPTVFTRTDVELIADWSAMDDIASLSTIGGLASVVNDYPAFDFSEAAAGEAPAADGRLRVFTVYHGNMRQDCTGGHVSWDFEEDGTMPESYLSRERAEEKFREWSGDLQGEFDREAACRGGRPTVMMARTGYGVELRQEVWERDEDGEWTIATDDLGLMESETLDTASYTLDDHLAAIERQEREQGYDLASACRESCLAADALAKDEKNDLDGRRAAPRGGGRR